MPHYPAPTSRAEKVARFVQRHPPQVVLRALSLRLAKQCREIIQGCLREEEWRDCDEEFFLVIHGGLAEWLAALGASQQAAKAKGAPHGDRGAPGSLAMRPAK